jgi:hypothetical protein
MTKDEAGQFLLHTLAHVDASISPNDVCYFPTMLTISNAIRELIKEQLRYYMWIDWQEPE